MNYIGVDCHISTLDFAVVDGKGTIKKKACVNTGVKEFMKFVRSIPKPRKIFIEEGELASWLSAGRRLEVMYHPNILCPGKTVKVKECMPPSRLSPLPEFLLISLCNR